MSGTISIETLSEGPGPKYKRVADAIRRAVERGDLTQGDKLPPVRDLAWTLKITPGTVARAYGLLTDQRVLTAEIGRGTFVANPEEPSSALVPIEVDVVPHGGLADTQSDEVNLFSPHLPCVGQAELIRGLLGQIAQDPPSGLMHYPSRSSAKPAREAVLNWLSSVALGPIQQQNIVLAHGGQNAIMLVFQAVLRGPRPAILVEELSYPGFRRAAELMRADVIPVAMDKDGVLPDALEVAILSNPNAQIFCTSPDVQNPTCSFTPEDRRQEVVRIVQRHDVQILEDDCYHLGRTLAPSYRRLAPGRSWYVSSISKLITPALRIGFAVAPDGQDSTLRRAAEHGFFGLATPISDLCAVLLGHPQIHDLTAKMQEISNDYVKRAVNVLGSYDLSWRQDVPFLWLMLPEGWRAGSFCRAAEGQGVQIRSAEEFACREANSPHAVRFAVNAGISADTFEAAMLRLRNLLDNPPEQIGV